MLHPFDPACGSGGILALRIARLRRRFGLAPELAATLALLAFGEGRQD